jgi:hypothetical protein
MTEHATILPHQIAQTNHTKITQLGPKSAPIPGAKSLDETQTGVGWHRTSGSHHADRPYIPPSGLSAVDGVGLKDNERPHKRWRLSGSGGGIRLWRRCGPRSDLTQSTSRFATAPSGCCMHSPNETKRTFGETMRDRRMAQSLCAKSNPAARPITRLASGATDPGCRSLD